MTKQARHQQRKVAAGICRICTQPIYRSERCRAHYLANANASRERRRARKSKEIHP
jgi:hypothetical protein